MSSFSLPPLRSGIDLDVSPFTAGMAQVANAASAFPGMIQGGIDAPMAQASEQMGHAAQAAAGVGEAVEGGMLASGAALALFPPLIIETIEDPLLGAIAVVGELGEKVGDIVGEVAQHFRSIDLESLKTGLDPATFSTFSAAAKASGVEVSSFANGLELLQQRAATALAGDAAGAKGFEELGISAKQLSGMIDDPKEMLLAMADAMKAMPTQGERVRVAMDAMGRGGKEMLPFLQLGRDGIDDLATHLGDLGARVGAEEAGLGATWAKVGADFSAMWEGVESALATPVLQYLEDHMGEIMPKVQAFAGWLKDGVGGAMQQLGPWVETVWGFASGLGDTIGSVIMPLLDVMLPILKGIAEAVKSIMDFAGIGLNSIAGILQGAAGLVTGDLSGSEAAFGRANDSANRFVQDLSGAGPTVNVRAEIKMDPGEASSQIAAKLLPHVNAGYEDIKRQMSAAAGTDKVKRGLGGKR